MHFMRQAVVNINKEKENTSKPTRIAPITLVAAMSIIKSMAANKMLPRIPSKRTETTEHRARQDADACVNETASSITSKKTSAIIIALCNKTGAMVITAVIWRNAAIMPRIKLATIAIPVQLNFVLQFEHVIYYSPPSIIYE